LVPLGLIIWLTNAAPESDAEDANQSRKAHWYDFERWYGRSKSKPKCLSMRYHEVIRKK